MEIVQLAHIDLEELCRRLLGYWWGFRTKIYPPVSWTFSLFRQVFDNSLLLTVFDHFVETTTDKVPELDETLRRMAKPIEILATRPNLDATRLNRTSFFHGIDINADLASRIYWLARSIDIDILVGVFMRVGYCELIYDDNLFLTDYFLPTLDYHYV